MGWKINNDMLVPDFLHLFVSWFP